MATIFLDPDESGFRVINNNSTILGQTGSEHVIVEAGVTGLTLDQNIERVDFSGNVSDFTFQQQGNQLLVYSSGNLTATVPLQSDSNGSQVVFNDGSVEATLSGGVMSLGGSTVGTTAGAVVPGSIDTGTTTGQAGGTTQAVSASTAGTVMDASSGDITYQIAAGNYNQQIQGFSNGDVLDFPAGNNPTVFNSSYTDGQVDVSFALSGSTTTIQLTGISAANDAQLNNIADFNTLFGSGTIV